MAKTDLLESSQSRRAEEWLAHLKRASADPSRGRLVVFLGMSAGVGKTFAMLKAAQAERAQGRDVVIGIVETHGRQETQAEAAGIEELPRKKVEYQGTLLQEFDLDAAIKRKPGLILVDELAHTNIPGSRHPKRYQDVLELLGAGIDVFTTLNVQHLESRADAVAAITGIPVRETVPDGVLDQAIEVQLIDLSPEKLMERLREGKVYLGERKDLALKNFFKRENITALRELALRVTAERVDRDLLDLRKSAGVERTWQTFERLLVAIGPNPQGEKLIRAARRTAQQLEAPWIVVYVKDGTRLDSEEEKYLERNLSLARELGAEVIVRDDPDRVEGLVRTAHERNATQILLGKPEGSFAFSLRSRWLERLFNRAGGIEIVFVPTASERKRGILASDAPWWKGPKHHYAYALVILVLTVFVGLGVYNWLGYFGVGLLMLSTVFGAGLFLSPSSVVSLSVAEAIAWNFFFIEPRYTFFISRPEDIALCVIFVVTAVTLGGATARLRIREEKYRRGELEALAQADLLAIVRDSDQEPALLREATVLLERYFGAKSTFLFRGKSGGAARKPAIETIFHPTDREMAVAAWCIEHGREAGKWTDTLREADVWCTPLRAGKALLGAWMIQARDSRIDSPEREVIRTLAASLALGVERIRLARAEQDVVVAQESARLQQTLLNSVSHEIRTPLTSVIGFLELWSERASEGEAKQVPLQEIAESLANAKDVDRILEDLVSLNRLESHKSALKLDWIDLEEIVDEKAKLLRQRYPDHQIQSGLGVNDYVLVEADPRVLKVVVRNLLDNACKHTPGGTTVRTRWKSQGRARELWVEDSGSGIPPELRKRIFERFFRPADTTGGRGLGLGLSISEGFMNLLGGSIRYEESELGGAAFVLSFPIERVREGGLSQEELPPS